MKKAVLFALLLLAGCNHAKTAKLLSNGQDHHIIQFSGGQKVGEWTSNGRVYSEDGSDGYFFEDKFTGRVVEVSGDIQITIQ